MSNFSSPAKQGDSQICACGHHFGVHDPLGRCDASVEVVRNTYARCQCKHFTANSGMPAKQGDSLLGRRKCFACNMGIPQPCRCSLPTRDKITPAELQALRSIPTTSSCGWFGHKDEFLGELTTAYVNVYRCSACGRITTSSQGSGCDH